MATTTKSRKLRRMHLQEIKYFLNDYTRDPGQALQGAFKKYGREQFERVLGIYIRRHSIRSALAFTLKRFIEKGEYI